MEKKKNKEDKIEIEKKIIELKLNNANNRVHLLQQLQEDFCEINKSVNKCIDLISMSMKGTYSQTLYEDMYDTNLTLIKQSKDLFERDIDDIKREIEIYTERKKELSNTKED